MILEAFQQMQGFPEFQKSAARLTTVPAAFPKHGAATPLEKATPETAVFDEGTQVKVAVT